VTVLGFEVLDAWPEPHAAVPTIMMRLRVSETSGGSVHALALRCQIRIEPQRRRYQAEEEERLYELFGDTPRWGDSLRPFLWTHVSTTIAGFDGWTEFELPVECTYDFDVAGAKYLHSLAAGEIPLLLLFSGSVFTRGESGFSIEPLSWSLEASYRMPVAVWRDMMDSYYPNCVWLNLRRDVFERLYQYKMQRGIPTWEQALEEMLPIEETVNS